MVEHVGGDSNLLEAARVEIERVLEQHPDSAEAHRRYARYHINEAMVTSAEFEPKGLARAAQALDRALELDPQAADTHLMRAEVFRLQRRLEDAKAALRRAEALGEDSAWVHLEWADLLFDEDKPEEALARCRAVEKAGRSFRDAADRCAIAPLWRLGRYDEVDRIYRAILARDPESAWAHGNYARFLLCGRRDAEAAAEWAARALSLMNYGHARGTLAAALYRHWAELVNAGKSKEADAVWARAVATAPGDPVAYVSSACDSGSLMPVLRAMRDTGRGRILMPVETVLLTAEAAPEWLPGVFGLQVVASGRGQGREAGQVFLNSTPDYRDPRNVTVRFTAAAATAYRLKNGQDPDAALKGKRILVYGFARQQRIDFVRYGVPTGKYYYQTHIVVADPDQVAIFDPEALPPPPPPAPGVEA